MAKKPETRFKEKVKADLDTLERVWYLKTQEMTRRGTPDILACVNGKFFALELKVDSRIDPLQEWNLQKIRKANGSGWEVNPTNWPELFSILKQVDTQEAS